MLYKPDWPEARERIEAWWRREVIDRVALGVDAPRKQPIPGPPPPPPADPVQRWTDIDYRLDAYEARFARIYFGGEAFPTVETGFGPGTLGVLLGAEPTWMPETVWYRPTIPDLSSPPTLSYDPDGHWWSFLKRFAAETMRRARDRFLPTIPDLIENLDTLAALHGTQPLLIDFIDEPDGVHHMQRQILPLFLRYYEEFYQMLDGPSIGSGPTGFNVWGDGRVAKLQCDIGALISPRQFEEFALPYFVEQCRRLDYVLWHLDGQENINHLDMILELPNLKAVQWVPNAGGPPGGSPHWYPLYRRLLAAGKGVTVGVGINDVEPMVREFGPEGLLLLTDAPSEEEANDLLRQARTWRTP